MTAKPKQRHRSRSTAAAALLVWGAAAGMVGAQGDPGRYAVTSAHVVTGTGQTIDNGTVIIEEGLITAVGASSDVTVPAGAWVIDARGKFVYPGWIDSLAPIVLAASSPRRDESSQPSRQRGQGEQAFAAGPEDRPATSSWRNAADEWKLDEERAESWRGSGFTSAVIAPSEGIFPGQAALVNYGSGRDRESVVAAPVALSVSFDVPSNRRSFPGSLMGVLAYVKQSFFDAAHYGAVWAAYEADPQGKKRPHYDRALVPITEALEENWPVLFPAHREHEVHRAVALAREVGVSRPLVFGLHDGYSSASFLKSEDVPALVSLDWPKAPEDGDPEAEVPLRELRLRAKSPSSPGALEEAGVRFGFYSDGLKPDEALAAVRKAVASGLSREGAVRALTLNAATIFGLDDRLGSLEPGKIANIVVASGDLFEDGAHVESVFVDGRKYEVAQVVADSKESEVERR